MFTINPQDYQKKRLVQSVYLWEKDLLEFQMLKQRYETLLADPNFTGSTFSDGTTFRQKIEAELPIIEGRIAECEALIASVQEQLPPQEEIQQILTELNLS